MSVRPGSLMIYKGNNGVEKENLTLENLDHNSLVDIGLVELTFFKLDVPSIANVVAWI
jgi:hypothetical protein